MLNLSIYKSDDAEEVVFLTVFRERTAGASSAARRKNEYIRTSRVPKERNFRVGFDVSARYSAGVCYVPAEGLTVR